MKRIQSTSPITCRAARRFPVRAAIHPLVASRPLVASHAADAVLATTLRRFASEIAEACDGSNLIRYPHRQQLLRRAGQLNIRRFDANLLIAAVQHRSGLGRAEVAPAAPAATRSCPNWVRFAGLFVVVQGLLLATGWLLLGA